MQPERMVRWKIIYILEEQCNREQEIHNRRYKLSSGIYSILGP